MTEPKLMEPALMQEEFTEKTFTNCFNRMLELKVKNVPMSKEMLCRLYYKLYQFGMRKLSGNLSGVPGLHATWKASSISRMRQWFRVFRSVEQDECDYLSINDDVLLRLRLIHNELMILSSEPELLEMGVPLEEMVYCLAVFLLTFNGDPRFEPYKLLLNPVNVKQFLEAILDAIHRRGVHSKGTRKTLKKLRKVYGMVRGIYVVSDLEQAMSALCSENCSESIRRAAVDNLVTRIERSVNCFSKKPIDLGKHLSSQIKMFRSVKDCEDNLRDTLYTTFLKRLPLLETLCKLVLSDQLKRVFCNFLQLARDCKSVEKLRSFCQYVQRIDPLVEHYSKLNQRAAQFYSQLELSSQTAGEATGKIKAIQSWCISGLCFNPARVLLMAEYSMNFSSFRKQIAADLAWFSDLRVTRLFRQLWSSIEWEVVALGLAGDSFVGENELESECTVDESGLATNGSAVLEDLRREKQNRPTVDVVEVIDETIQSLTEQGTKPKLKMVQGVSFIQEVLVQYKYSSIDALAVGSLILPQTVRMAIEHWLTECFENLIRFRIFGDSSELIKIGSGLMMGSNFLALLKSEAPSYELLVDDRQSLILIVALLLTEIPHDSLLQQLASLPIGLKDLRHDGVCWVQKQQRLLEVASGHAVGAVRTCVLEGAQPTGKFLSCLGKFDGFTYHSLETMIAFSSYDQLVRPNEQFIDLFNLLGGQLVPDETFNIALNLSKFEDALSLNRAEIDCLNPKFYRWSLLIESLVNNGIDSSAWNPEILKTIVEKLVINGNLRSLVTLLKFTEDFVCDSSLISKAIESGNEELVETLFSRSNQIGKEVIHQAITAGMNRLIPKLIFDFDKSIIAEIIESIVKANNIEMVDSIAFESMEELLYQAVRANRVRLVQHLIRKHCDLNLDSALFTAASQNCWPLATILQRHGADPCFRSTSCELPSLLTAFQHAIRWGNVNFLRRGSSAVTQLKDLNILTLAANVGSVRMMKHLLRMGFLLVDEPEAFLTAVHSGRMDVQKLFLSRLRLRWRAELEPCELTVWINYFERWKFLDFLKQVVGSEVFQNSTIVDSRVVRFVLRRLKLYQMVDECFCVSNIFMDLGTNLRRSLAQAAAEFQSLLNEKFSSVIQQRFEVHIFGKYSNQYAFVKLCIFIYQASTLHGVTEALEIVSIGEELNNKVICQEIKRILRFWKIIPNFSCDSFLFSDENEIRRFKTLQLDSVSCTVELHQITENYVLLPLKDCSEEVKALARDIIEENRLHLAVGSVDLEVARELLKEIEDPIQSNLWLDLLWLFELVAAVEVSERRRIQMTALLLCKGINCKIRHPSTNQSVCGFALANGFTSLAEFLISHECAGLSVMEAFRSAIEFGSIDVFKLFLKMNNYNERQVFENISNTLLELNVRSVPIEEELHIYLQYLLAKYGFQNLTTESSVPKSVPNWLESVQLIVNWITDLSSRPDRNQFLAIDNELLFRLRMIHNQLFTIKDRPPLKQLPLRELTFIIAIFLSSFKSTPEGSDKIERTFDVYRLVLNKPTLLKFLETVGILLAAFRQKFTKITHRMIEIIDNSNGVRDKTLLQNLWQQDESLPKVSENAWNFLTSKKNAHLSSEELVMTALSNEFAQLELRTSKRERMLLKKLTKLYHRLKAMYSFNKILHILGNFNPQEASKPILVASMKRFIQIFGESIKNTAQSQNLPAKLVKILEQLIFFVQYHKQSRDIACHDYPLSKKNFPIDDQYRYYESAVRYLKLVEVSLSILLVCINFDFIRCFFGSLKSCRSLEACRELIRYTGNQLESWKWQLECFDRVKKYHSDVEAELSEASSETLSGDSAKVLTRLMAKHSQRLRLLEFLQIMLPSKLDFNYEEIQTAAFATNDVEVLRRMLYVNLNCLSQSALLFEIKIEWPLLRDDLDQLETSKILLEKSPSIMVKTQINIEIGQKSEQQYQCSQETKKILNHFSTESNNFKELTDKLNQKLQGKSGKGYFNNIFSIDAKTQAIQSVLCRENIPGFQQKLTTLREQDEIELQNIFDGIQRSILQTLDSHNCATIENLLTNWSTLPSEAILAMESWMLELSEILITTKHFRDNFHSILRGSQFICGRNFRNYLAHDGLSYDLLTNSGRIKVLLNALVMAETKWKLFRVPAKSDSSNLREEKTWGFVWIKSQNSLKQAAMSCNSLTVKDLTSQGAMISGRFWHSLGGYDQIRLHKMFDLFSFTKSEELIKNPIAKSTRALLDPTTAPWDYSKMIDLDVILCNSTFNSWDQLLKSDICKRLYHASLGAVVHHLFVTNDLQGILDLILTFPHDLAPVILATAPKQCIDFLLNKIPELKDGFAVKIIMIKQDDPDLLGQLIPKKSVDVTSLIAIIKLNNLRAFERFLLSFSGNFPNPEVVLWECARYGRVQMMETLLNDFGLSSNGLEEPLLVAVQYQQWRMAEFLLSRGANPFWTDVTLNISAVKLVILLGSFQMLRKFVDALPESERTAELLTVTAQYGTVRMLQFLLKSGWKLPSDASIFRAAAWNETDSNMISVVKNRLFYVEMSDKLDCNLNEWLRILQESKALEMFKSSTRSGNGVLGALLQENVPLVDEVLREMECFGRTNECDVIRIVSFDNSLEPNISTERLVEQYSAIQHEILNTEISVPKQCYNFEIKYEINEEKIATVHGHLTVYEGGKCNEETFKILRKLCRGQLSKFQICSNISENCIIFPALSRGRLRPFMVHPARKNLGNSAAKFTSDFEIIDHTNSNFATRFRFLKMRNNHCLTELLKSSTTSLLEPVLNFVDQNGNTILHLLPPSTPVDLIDLLFLNGANPSTLDRQGRTFLHNIVQRLHVPWEMIERLLGHCSSYAERDSHGIHLFDVLDSNGRTVLLQAAIGENLPTVEYLLQRGSDQTITDRNGYYPLYIAVILRNIAMVNALLNHQPEVMNLPHPDNGETVLAIAAAHNNGELVRLFLAAGADPNARDFEGFTAVAKAIENGGYETLKIILEYAKQFNLDVINDVAPNKKHALRYCMTKDDVEMFKIVLEFLIGGPVYSSMDKEACFKLKGILLNEGKYSLGFHVFLAAEISGHRNIYSYLLECQSMHNQLADEMIDRQILSDSELQELLFIIESL